jgi:hypothetical protein
MANILAPHRERTIRRMMGQKTVLCIQDGSDLNYNNLSKCSGLGGIGSNQTKTKSRGLHMHSLFTVSPNGLPLGVLASQCEAAKPKSAKEKRATRHIPIEEKKTFVWLKHHRDLEEIATRMPQTRLIDVCDREADFFEFLDERRNTSRVDLLVRAQNNRNLEGETLKLFDAVRKAPLLGRYSLHIQRQSARPKKSKQKTKPKRPGRTSKMAVRSKRVELPPPEYFPDKEPLDLWIVHAVEEAPPEGCKAVEWFLLTTLEISTVEDAEQCLSWYALRWRIEDWHRVLKTGCRIEDLAHETAERLRRAIAINMVIAWRIMLMTLLGRENPDLPAEVMFSDIEIRALAAFAKGRGYKSPHFLGDAVKLIGRIGGHLGRKNDPPPGHQLLWRGYREFKFMCLGFSLHDTS